MQTFIEIPVQLRKNTEDDDRLEDLGVKPDSETYKAEILLNIEKIERINPIENEDYKSVIWIDEEGSYRCYLTYTQLQIILEDLGCTIKPNPYK